MTVTTTTYTDPLPSPRVEVVVDTAASPTVDRVDLYRVTLDDAVLVRGALDRPVAGPVLVVDYEVPFGVEVQYRAVGKDSAGLIVTEWLSAELTVDVDVPWWSSPLTPALALRVRRAEDYAAERTFVADTEYLGVIGRPRLALLSDQRRPAAGSYSVITRTAQETTVMRALLTDAPSVLARHPASWGIGSVYIAAETITEQRWASSMEAPGRVWPLTATETGGPSPVFTATFWTWEDLMVNATWADVLASKASWLDVLRDPT